MKINHRIAAPIAVFVMAAMALALCPGPVNAQWNGNVGRCVAGFWVNYCQDTELVQDAACSGGQQDKFCQVGSHTASMTKHVYQPLYSGQCTLDQTTNPCYDATPPDPDYISYHDQFITGFPGSC